MMHVTLPEIVRVLASAGSAVSAVESHGMLCGALCTTADYPFERWLEEILPDEAPSGDDAAARALQLLYDDTVRALRGDEMEFEPVLPDDDQPLDERAAAIAQWCHGYLYGFGTSHISQDLPSDVDEVLRDFSEIGRASTDAAASGEEDEEAYAELVEYVRVGVQLIHDELADAREAAAQPSTRN